LQQALNEKNIQIQQLNEEISKKEEEVLNLNQKHEEEIQKLKEIYENKLNEMNANHENDLSNIKELFREKVNEANEAVKQEIKSDIIESIKELMSSIYFNISGRMNKESKYRGEKILNLLQEVIKKTTIKLIK